MEEDKTKLGRPRKEKSNLKKSRSISLTDSQWQQLRAMANAAKMEVSSFIAKELKLE